MDQQVKQPPLETPQPITRTSVHGLVACGLISLSVGLGAYFFNSTAKPSAGIHSEQLQRGANHRSHCSAFRGDARRIQLSFTGSTKKQWLDQIRTRLFRAQANTDPVGQRDALKACLDELTPEMAASLLTTMDPSDLKSLAAAQLFDFWVMAEPANAAAWTQKLDDATTMSSFMNLVALRWAVSDLKEAVSWVHTLSAGSVKNDLIRSIASEAVRSDPQEALRLAASLPEDLAQADLVCRAASEWAVMEPAPAKEWAEHIEDKLLRERVIRDIAVTYAEKDPSAAVAMLQGSTAEGPEQDCAIVSIVQSWTQKDPLLVSTWVRQFPDDKLGRDAINNVVQIWASKDLQASGTWLLTLPSSEMKDAGILAYARVVKRTNENLAEQWVSCATRRE
jgi:hypothetical protein